MTRLLTALVVALTAMLAAPATATVGRTAAPVPHRAAFVPDLEVTTIASGLDLPWDVQTLGGGRLLITERTSRRLLLWDHGAVRPVVFPSSSIWASGETGLMSLAVDPGFASNRRFYTCQGGVRGPRAHEVRVVAWRLDESATRATRVKTLLRGLPATSGRHGGCRLLITSYGALMVGTGDAAVGTNARSIYSLGGKTLRMNRSTGAPWPTNPYIRSRSLNPRYVVTRGHRNVQGLVQRYDGSIWSVEQGTDRDDEVNRLAKGGDYGWNPTPGYNESRPMTDHGLPGAQIRPRWRSGYPTIATSDAAWVRGKQWGDDNGTLAVGALKGERLVFLKFDAAGRLVRGRTPAALRSYGRLRSVTRVGSGDLLVTTANGGGVDRVLRVHPRG